MLLDGILKVIDRSNRSTPKQRGKERGEGERGRREGKRDGGRERINGRIQHICLHDKNREHRNNFVLHDNHDRQ